MAGLLPALLPSGSGFPYPSSSQPAPGLTFEGPVITGIPMPGRWVLNRNVKREYGWQIQQPNFLTGGYLIPKGDPLISIEYDIAIWEGPTAAIYRQLLGTLLKKPALAVPGVPSSAALGINDPQLKDINVTHVVVKSASPLHSPLASGNPRGPWTARVEFYEWRQPVPVIAIPDQSIPDPGAVTPSAAANHGTAVASITQGMAGRQASKAQALLNK